MRSTILGVGAVLLVVLGPLAGCASSGLVIDDQTRAAAEAGDADAAFKLGIAYDLGLSGVKQDRAEAARWFRRSAEAGHANAAQSLGHCYEEGTGVRQDYAEARRWYQTAIDRGNHVANHNLGYLYDLGLGVREDNRRAVELYRDAVKAGSAEAMINLGLMHGAGDGGLHADPVEAFAWIDLGRFYAGSNATKWHARNILDRMRAEGMITREQVQAASERSDALQETYQIPQRKVTIYRVHALPQG